MHDMKIVSKYINMVRTRKRQFAKRYAKYCQTAFQKKQKTKKMTGKKLKQNQVKISSKLTRMCMKGFWKDVDKIQAFNFIKELKKIKAESQQNKLEDFVTQQMRLSEKLAEILATPIVKTKSQRRSANKLSAGSKKSQRKSGQKILRKFKKIDTGKISPFQKILPSGKEKSDSKNGQNSSLNRQKMKKKQDMKIIIQLKKRKRSDLSLLEENAQKEREEKNVQYEIDQIYKIPRIQQNLQNFHKQSFLKKLSINLPEPYKIKTSQGVEIKQPYFMRGKLRNYQLLGMHWCLTLHDKRINGILADEMGLGKTIQTIALLATLAISRGIWGPHLIVVPTSLLMNWEIEFKRWFPSFKILTYFGSIRERKEKRHGWSTLNSFNICITSYKLAVNDKKMFRRKKWYYLILDEAQYIKNFKSQSWQSLLMLNTKKRLLLTGTPLQNDVTELWSLMHFLMPRIFHSHSDFQQWFAIPMRLAMQKNLPIAQETISKLQQILRPFILRRLKRDVEKQLPKKQEFLIKCPLSRRQKFLYDEFINLNKTQQKLQSQEFVGLINILMKLRKVCNHPDIFEPRQVESAYQMTPQICFKTSSLVIIDDLYLGTNIRDFLGKYEGFDFHRIFQQNRTMIEYEMAQALLLQDLQISDKKLRDGIQQQQISSKVKNPFIKEFLQEQHISSQARLQRNYYISNKRVINQKPIYCHQLYQKVQILALQEGLPYIKELPLGNQFLIQEYCYPLADIEYSQYKNKEIINEFIFINDKVACQKGIRFISSPYKHSFERHLKNVQQVLAPAMKKYLQPFHPIQIRQEIIFPNKKLLVFDCGKMNTMIRLLKRLKSQGHKVLIFTQMSKMLDIFEKCLSQFYFNYVRMDGGTKPDKRQMLVEIFNHDPKKFAFISSTRTGGLGLNLTAADTVIFYETDWNPAMDLQAQDRCHRIGQTRDVSVYRLISESTIEENILLKNMQKRQIDSYIMEEGQFNTESFKKFSVKDILGDMIKDKKLGQREIVPQNNEFFIHIHITSFSTQSYAQLEKTLEQIEDDEDVQATKQVKREQQRLLNNQAGEDFGGGGMNRSQQSLSSSISKKYSFQQGLQMEMLPPLYKYGLYLVEKETNQLKELQNLKLQQKEKQDLQILQNIEDLLPKEDDSVDTEEDFLNEDQARELYQQTLQDLLELQIQTQTQKIVT